MNRSNLAKLALAGLISGGMGLTACEKKATEPGNTGIKEARTLDEFKAKCAEAGGAYTHHANAGGNECGGYSYNGVGNVGENTCAGTGGMDHCRTN